MKRISSLFFLFYLSLGCLSGFLFGADAGGAGKEKDLPPSLSENVLEEDLKLRAKISFAFEYPYSFEAEHPELEAGRLELEELKARIYALRTNAQNDTFKMMEEGNLLFIEIFKKSLERMKLLDRYAMKGEALKAVILRDETYEFDNNTLKEAFPLFENLDVTSTRREIFAGFWTLLIPSSFEEVKESLKSKLAKASVSEEKIVTLLEKAQASFQAYVAFVKKNQSVFDSLLKEKKETVTRESDFSLCEVLSEVIELHVAALGSVMDILRAMGGPQDNLSNLGFNNILNLEYYSTNESTRTTGPSKEESLVEKEAFYYFVVEYLKADEEELGEEFLSERDTLESLFKEVNELGDKLFTASRDADFEVIQALYPLHLQKKQELLTAVKKRFEKLKKLEKAGLVEFKPCTKEMLISVKVVDKNSPWESSTREQFYYERGIDLKTTRREIFHGTLCFEAPSFSQAELQAGLESIEANEELISFMQKKLKELTTLAKSFEEENKELLASLYEGREGAHIVNNFAVFDLIAKITETEGHFSSVMQEVLGRLSPEQIQILGNKKGSGNGFSFSASYLVLPDTELAETDAKMREEMRK